MINCKICDSSSTIEIFSGKIRSGSFGNMTDDIYTVLKCNDCNTIFLDKFVNLDYYESEEYRENYNDIASVKQYQSLQDDLENEKVYRIGLHNCRDKIIADFGSGAGSFLDAVYGYASLTIAIEPSKHFHNYLSNKHKVYSYGRELLKDNQFIDIATSFDVIEHVEQPIKYLREIYESLKIDGELFLMTPNYEDILNVFIKEDFDTFNYRTAHLYYFEKKSINYILEKVGFKNIEISYLHKQDISNLIFWLRDKKPTGKNKTDIFDRHFNVIYKEYIEQKGLSSHLWIRAKK